MQPTRFNPARSSCWFAACIVAAAVSASTAAAARQVLAPPKSGFVVVEPDPKPVPNGTGLIAGRAVLAGPGGAGGAAVPGALVSLKLPGGERAAALTNQEGRFVFAALPAGSFTLTAERSGYLAGAFGRVRPAGPFQTLELAAGQQRSDITLTLWKQAAVSGLVIDEAGEPIVNGPLQILRRDTVAGARRLSSAGTTKTDDRGIYRFWGLNPGDYVVALLMNERPDGPGDPAGPQTYPAMYYLEAISASRATVIPVASGEERVGVDFQLRPVRALTVSGTLVGPDGPAARVPVTLSPAEATDLNSPIETTVIQSGADGAFAFSNVSPGLYTLRAIKTYTDSPARVSGHVTSQTGAADRTTSVVFFPVDSTIWSGAGASAARMRRVRTTEGGAYSMINLPAGSYFAAAVPDELAAGWDDPAMLDALSKVATRIEITEAAVKTQDLRVVKIAR